MLALTCVTCDVIARMQTAAVLTHTAHICLRVTVYSTQERCLAARYMRVHTCTLKHTTLLLLVVCALHHACWVMLNMYCFANGTQHTQTLSSTYTLTHTQTQATALNRFVEDDSTSADVIDDFGDDFDLPPAPAARYVYKYM